MKEKGIIISESLFVDLLHYFLLDSKTEARENRICKALNLKHDAMMRRKQYISKNE